MFKVIDSDDLRSRFRDVMKTYMKTQAEVCNEIEISLGTLISFVNNNKNTNHINLCKIEKWVEKQESERD